MINRNKTEISDVKNKSELSEKVEKEEVENEEFINIKDIPNETPEDIYLRLDRAKLVRAKELERAKEDEKERNKPLESMKIQMQRLQNQQQHDQLRLKPYPNDSLETFNSSIQEFSSGVSVF
jgi:hypothetical protein